jgi:cullin 1
LNMNWIRKRLEDSKNKLGSVYQTSAASEIYEISSLALVTWKERLFMKVKDRLMRAVEDLITRDRDGEQIVTSQVSGLVQCLIKLGNINKTKQLELYKEEFEAAYLENTRDYYARESAAYIAANGVSAYMIKAEQRLDEEKTRAQKFLDPSSFDKVRKECDTVLIERHKDLMQVGDVSVSVHLYFFL